MRPASPTRRNFLAAVAATGCACALDCPLLREAAGAPPQGEIDVGVPTDFGHDGIFDAFLASNRILVVREGARLFVLRAICTHRTANLRLRVGVIVCKSHGSRFNRDGSVTKGPASRPLTRYGVRLNNQGRIIVDPSQTFAQDQSNDPASFLDMKTQ